MRYIAVRRFHALYILESLDPGETIFTDYESTEHDGGWDSKDKDEIISMLQKNRGNGLVRIRLKQDPKNKRSTMFFIREMD